MSKISQQIKDLIAKSKALQDKLNATNTKVDDFIASTEEQKQKTLNELYAEWKASYDKLPDIPPEPEPEPEPTPEPPEPAPTPEPPEPQPNISGLPDLSKGTVLFDSNKVWADGNDRTMTGHHEYDKFDPKTEVAAGGHGTPRVWHVDGKGHTFLSGGMSRVYNHSPHQGTIVILDTFIFNETLDNRSYEWFSRHNEGGAKENRTGGDQNHFSLKERGAKHESYHASYHESVKDGPYPNGKEIKVGDEVRIAIVGTKNGTNYKSQSFIDWDHNGNYQKVMESDYTEQETPGGCEPQPLYWRFRVNGNAPKEVESYNCKFIQL